MKLKHNNGWVVMNTGLSYLYALQTTLSLKRDLQNTADSKM